MMNQTTAAQQSYNVSKSNVTSLPFFSGSTDLTTGIADFY